MVGKKVYTTAITAVLMTTTALVPSAFAQQVRSTTAEPVSTSYSPTDAEKALPSATGFTGPQIVVRDRVLSSAENRVLTDMALNSADIRMTFDGLETTPLLNVGHVYGGTAVLPGARTQFATYWNYTNWVERAEIRLFAADSLDPNTPIAILPVDVANSRAEWIAPDTDGAQNFTYVLRVYDPSGKYDETVAKSIRVVAGVDEASSRTDALSPIFGKDATASRNIQVRGAAITVSGQNMTPDQISNIRVMGSPVAADTNGDFAVRQIIPTGQHAVDVSFVRADGKTVQLTRDIDIPENDFFFVALGDLTVGTRSSAGRELLEASGEDFDETYVTGRGAFYLKGKIKGKYLLTASMDTTEDDIDNLFSNLAEKDPQSLLRRLDPDRYYPVYGDDSTYVDDAPTQGRFYVRMERGDDHVVWGNFFTNVTDTEFAQIDRGLYGAKAEFNSNETTEHGTRKFSATVFAADPGTIPGREEFRATGGSVYFLERQDITIASERLRVEVRDQDSGLVLETRELKPFADYDIDYIQGRVLLNQPLNSTALTDQIVRDGTLSGNDVYLVARYEHTPGLQDIDGFSTGGRLEGWLTDGLRFGVTAQDEETADADQNLIAGDLLLRKSQSTYFKAEIAQSKGRAFDERASLDGGFTFSPLSAGAGVNDDALAWRVEGGALMSDLTDAKVSTKFTGYFERLDDGFSGVGRLTQDDTERFGVNLNHTFKDAITVDLKYDDVSIDNVFEESTLAVDLRGPLSKKWSAGIGARHSDVSTSSIGNDGTRTDLGIELRYQKDQSLGIYGFGQGTLNSNDNRQDANRLGLGIESAIGKAIQVRGEVSSGDGGGGALAGLTWKRENGEEYYLNYSLDAERQEPGVDGNNFLSNAQNSLTTGARKRFSSTVSVYGEERAVFGDRTGITHAYGLDFQPDGHWSFGASMEVGELEDRLTTIEREAYTISAGYADELVNFGSAFEWINDDQNGVERETWLLRSNLGAQLSPDWRALLKFNKAESNSGAGSFFDGEFVEAQVAGAYRPVANDRLSALVRYTYFEDLATASQISSSGQTGLPAQKSNILSVDGNYRLSGKLTIGGKLGVRSGEVSLSRANPVFVESTAQLGVLRADYHIVKKWDVLVEGRVLDVDGASDTKKGALVAVYRHVGKNAKIGIGYNFTDFSDDLTDLSYDDDGAFLNIVAKF